MVESCSVLAMQLYWIYQKAKHLFYMPNKNKDIDFYFIMHLRGQKVCVLKESWGGGSYIQWGSSYRNIMSISFGSRWI